MSYRTSTSILLLIAIIYIPIVNSSRNNDELRSRMLRKNEIPTKAAEVERIKNIKRIPYGDRNMKDIYKEKEESQNNESKINWNNLVVVMLTYNSQESNRLIQAQYDTWMKKAGEGLDIVFVTDADDIRSDEEIIPFQGESIDLNFHVYKSDTPKEGKLARSKVVDSFLHVYEKFKGNIEKKFFLKIDPDSFILSENLINFLDELNVKTKNEPVDFGKGLCNNDFFCYSEGGLYGYNQLGFEAMATYLLKNENIFIDFIPESKDPEKNVLIHEDVFTSYVFWKSTGYPMIWNKQISIKSFFSSQPSNVLSIHPVKSYQEFYVLEKIFYNSENVRRDQGISHKLLQAFSASLDFVLFKWDYKQGRAIRK